MRGIALSLLTVFPTTTGVAAKAHVSEAAPAPAAGAKSEFPDDVVEMFGLRAVASPQTLAGLRGGFIGTAGGQRLELSFGIDQALFVNDRLVVTTRLTVPSINQPSGAQLQNIVAPTPPTIAAPTAPTPPTIAAPTAPTLPSITAPTAPTAPVVAAPSGPTMVIPTAPVIPPVAAPAAPVLTVGTPVAPVVPAVAAPAAPVITAVGASTVLGIPTATESSPSIAPARATVNQPPATPVATAQSGPAQSAAIQPPATQSAAAPVGSVSSTRSASAPGQISSGVGTGTTITTLQTATGVSNVVQIGPGNVFSFSPTQLPSGVMNVIQNSLDNQTIRQTTNIQLSANSLGVMRALNFGSALQRQILSSVR